MFLWENSGGYFLIQDNEIFDVEYSAGFWALGGTPVEPKTWGELKSLYSGE